MTFGNPKNRSRPGLAAVSGGGIHVAGCECCRVHIVVHDTRSRAGMSRGESGSRANKKLRAPVSTKGLTHFAACDMFWGSIFERKQTLKPMNSLTARIRRYPRRRQTPIPVSG